jgi:hypothetical protein
MEIGPARRGDPVALVQGSELLARERGALPDVLQQLVPAGRSLQRCGRLWPHQSFGEVGDGCCRRCGSDRGCFRWNRESMGVLMADQPGGLLAFLRVGLSPMHPIALLVRPFDL